MDATTIWTKACGEISQEITKGQFDTWLATLKPIGLEQNTLLLGVDNDYKQNWIEENYRDVIADALRNAAGGEPVPFRFVIFENNDLPLFDYANETVEADSADKKPGKLKNGQKKQLAANLDPLFTFEEYVIGPSNSFAHAAASAVAQAPGRTYNPLFIYGQTGLGKTHLIMAIGHRAVQNNPATQVAYVTSEALLNEFIQSIADNTTLQFRDRYRKVDILLVDDIHFLAGRKGLQEEFFHCFNDLHMKGKQIVMTSDRPAREIDGLEQRLVSRFESGLVTELESPDFETRLAILRYKQTPTRVTLSDACLTFIAENITSNVRTLQGALLRVQTFANLSEQPPTIDNLRNLLKDVLAKEIEADLTSDEIQRVVADHFDLRLTDMSSKRRPRSVALPRQVAMVLCRKLTRASLTEIADSFNKTHATVVHACKMIKFVMETDRDMAEQINAIIRKLGRDPSEIEF
ncbi:MAG: chromosomal replication initiator protein DnaA [Lentisphaerae bacterium]|jgi:chromosomal replication initiator protein|nr:chromosomal replication initiator protein DnaA [Lentisphaerota bacterium]